MTARYVAPADVTEVIAALAAGYRPIAGGTDLVVRARQTRAELPEALVWLGRVETLRRIAVGERDISIGAMATHRQIAQHARIRTLWTALADAASIIGSPATRATGTIGGNLANASPAADLVAPLLCLDARVELRSEDGARQVGLDELIVGPGRTTLGEALLGEIRMPQPVGRFGSAYVRLGQRRQMEIAIVGAAAALTLDEGGRVSHARVALTAVAPTVRRSSGAEAALIGSDGSDGPLAEAASRAAAEAQPISDVRASDRYRAAMTAVIVQRALETALARARGVAVPIPASDLMPGVV